jgi:predicted pyridoxine 5'-phosphate oxidase superfamily flavin-nucleotide-binding protein
MIELGENREWIGAQFSLKFFMTRYLHDPKTGALLKWLPHYEEWYRIVREEKRSNVESPRGHGKSLFWSYALPMWDVIRGGADFLLVSYSEGQVIELIRLIRQEIESNEFLAAIRPSTREIWMADKLGFSDGGIVRGLGFGTSARGLHPKRIVGDDMLKDTGGISPEDQQRFWFGVVGGMAMPETKIHAIGTPIDFGDLLEQLEKNPVYFNWKKAAELADGSPMCPELFTRESLEFKRKEQGSLIYAREFMLERIDPATQPFKREFESTYTEFLPRNRFASVATVVDPAYSENEGDYTAIVTNGLTHGNHGYLLKRTRIRRDNPGIIIQEIAKHINEWNPDAVGLKRRKGDAIAFSFEEWRVRNNQWNFKYVELKDTVSKKDKSRIGGLVPRWEARSLHVHKSMEDVLKELYEFRLDDSHSHDDMIDAWADCFSHDMVRPNGGKRHVPSRTATQGRPLFRVGNGTFIQGPDEFEPLWKRLDRRVYDAA